MFILKRAGSVLSSELCSALSCDVMAILLLSPSVA